MKKLFTTVAAMALLTATAHADARFLRAAVFFLDGGDDGLKYQITTDGMEVMGSEDTGAMIFQDKTDRCTVYYTNIRDEIPDRGSKLMNARRVNFNKMPSPRDFGSSYVSGIGGRMWSWVASLPPDAMIETTVRHEKSGPVTVSFPPTGKYWKSISWFDTSVNGNGPRRLRALDFIRNNYCPGLPEVRGF